MMDLTGKLLSDVFVNPQQNSNPTAGCNFVGVIEAYARQHGISTNDVVVQAIWYYDQPCLILHMGWVK